MVKVHTFESSALAYDCSQCDDEIKDGDVLSVPSERVVGVLLQAWPTAISEACGEFHRPAPDLDWSAVPQYEDLTRDYSASFDAAVEELDRIGLDEAERALADETERVSKVYRHLDDRG